MLGGWEPTSVKTWLNTNRTRSPVGFEASVTERKDLLLDVVVVFQTKLSDMGVGRDIHSNYHWYVGITIA